MPSGMVLIRFILISMAVATVMVRYFPRIKTVVHVTPTEAERMFRDMLERRHTFDVDGKARCRVGEVNYSLRMIATFSETAEVASWSP